MSFDRHRLQWISPWNKVWLDICDIKLSKLMIAGRSMIWSCVHRGVVGISTVKLIHLTIHLEIKSEWSRSDSSFSTFLWLVRVHPGFQIVADHTRNLVMACCSPVGCRLWTHSEMNLEPNKRSRVHSLDERCQRSGRLGGSFRALSWMIRMGILWISYVSAVITFVHQ